MNPDGLVSAKVKMRGRNAFYTLIVTQTLSLIGSRMTSIATGLWVFTTTGRAAPLLLTAFFNELPGLLGSSLAGVLVDRWERRRVLMLADAGQALGTLALLASIVTGRFELWHLYAVALLQGSFAILQQPAQAAAATLLVPAEQRERANAIQQMVFPLAGVGAPLFAGLLYTLVRIGGILAIDLATFLIAVVVVYFVHIPRPAPSLESQAARGRLWREARAGLRFIASRPPLLGLIVHSVLMNFWLNGPLELAIPYLISVTGDQTVLGTILGLTSLAEVGGALLIATWGGTRPRSYTLIGGALLTGLMFIAFGTARQPLLLGAALLLLSAPLPMGAALYVSIIQRKTPPDMQGRIFALVAQLEFFGATASFLTVGPLVDRVLEPAVKTDAWRFVAPLVGSQPGAGMGLLLALTGVLILLSTAVIYAFPQVRRLEALLPEYAAVVEE